MGLIAPQHVGSSRTRDRTHVPCIGRWILNHCATREVPSHLLNTLIQARDDEGLPTSGYISSYTPSIHIPAFLLTPPHYPIRANSSQHLLQVPRRALKLTMTYYVYGNNDSYNYGFLIRNCEETV